MIQHFEKHNVFIDSFKTNSNYSYHFITHAHHDHYSGIARRSKQKKHQYKVICTEMTMVLLCLRYAYLPKDSFIIIDYNKPILINGFQVQCFQAMHCDGSAMFLFRSNDESVLYTGDFRYYEDLKRFLPNKLHYLYFDDTWLNIPRNMSHPTYDATLLHFDYILRGLLKVGTSVHVNVSVLGFEPFLRAISARLGIKYSVSAALPTVRLKQLLFLLPDSISSDSNIILSHRDYDDVTIGDWIFPSSTHFLCQESKHKTKKAVVSHHYVPFFTHSNIQEIENLNRIVNPNYSIPCKYALQLTCSAYTETLPRDTVVTQNYDVLKQSDSYLTKVPAILYS